jgi:opacity protein-like surface antigen
MMEVTEMKKISIGALLVALAVVMAGPAQAAFTVGGENGWSLSTDGIVNIFAAYQDTAPLPDAATRDASPLNHLLGGVVDGASAQDQKFGVRVGLLPSILAFTVKAPTTAGIDSTVRVSFWPNNQNSGTDARFNTAPNIDNREFYYTAKGKFGELLAGRALNLFQGQNILNDMCLFSAGVVDMSQVRGGTSLGHIGYGYLYTNFGPQFRYTTPDMGGFKAALEIGEPYAIGHYSAKQDIPRIETELSYAATFKGGSVHAWLEGIWQQDTTGTAVGVPVGLARPAGSHNTSLGIAPGATVAVGPVTVNASGYYGGGLGMVSAQDGPLFGYNSTDVYGNTRTNWGFLGGATYQVTDSIKLGVNYGANHQNQTDEEVTDGFGPGAGVGIGGVPKKCQEALVGQANWNLNKFTVFTLEYILARDTWQDGKGQNSNQFALGTVFFW